LSSDGTPQDQLDGAGVVRAFDQAGVERWTAATSGLPQDLFLGDDGNLYVLTGGTTEGRIVVLDQSSGGRRLTIEHVPAPWEMILYDGVVYTAGDSGIAAIPLPQGFAVHYDPQSPWPIRQHDNQRTSQRVTITGLTAAAVTAEAGGSTPLSATLRMGSTPVGGKPVTFSIFGSLVGTALTDASGVATIDRVSLGDREAGSYPGALKVVFAGDAEHGASSRTADITVR
jgi:hypothetical protein